MSVRKDPRFGCASVVLLLGVGTVFVRTMERYSGDNERVASSEPVGAEVLGVVVGAAPPANLKPYDAAGAVWVFKDAKPKKYLGVPVQDVSFAVDRGRVVGVNIPSKGKAAYDAWRKTFLTVNGAPSSSWGSRTTPLLSWRSQLDDVRISLIYSSKPNQSVVTITRTE